jgi:8-oxo-dGTP pyrophosphatase MutT (NUDIX family)
MGLHLAALTADAPFQAGMLLFRGRRLVLTLEHDELPGDLPGPAVRAKWVGGGQEPGETPWECALREGHEEVGAVVDLVPSPVTHLHDAEEGALRRVECEDPDPPLLVERSERPSPDVAPAPGLPAGPYLYGVTFLAVAGAAAQLRPCGEVAGLLLLPLELWPQVLSGATLSALGEAGAELVAGDSVPTDARVWVHPGATIRLAVPLLDDAPVRDAVGLSAR